MSDKKQVLLFGANCGKCKKFENRIHNLVAQHKLDINFQKTEDIGTMMAHRVMYLPSLLIDGVLIFKGVVPSEKALLEKLKT